MTTLEVTLNGYNHVPKRRTKVAFKLGNSDPDWKSINQALLPHKELLYSVHTVNKAVILTAKEGKEDTLKNIKNLTIGQTQFAVQTYPFEIVHKMKRFTLQGVDADLPTSFYATLLSTLGFRIYDPAWVKSEGGWHTLGMSFLVHAEEATKVPTTLRTVLSESLKLVMKITSNNRDFFKPASALSTPFDPSAEILQIATHKVSSQDPQPNPATTATATQPPAAANPAAQQPAGQPATLSKGIPSSSSSSSTSADVNMPDASFSSGHSSSAAPKSRKDKDKERKPTEDKQEKTKNDKADKTEKPKSDKGRTKATEASTSSSSTAAADLASTSTSSTSSTATPNKTTSGLKTPKKSNSRENDPDATPTPATSFLSRLSPSNSHADHATPLHEIREQINQLKTNFSVKVVSPLSEAISPLKRLAAQALSPGSPPDDKKAKTEHTPRTTLPTHVDSVVPTRLKGLINFTPFDISSNPTTPTPARRAAALHTSETPVHDGEDSDN